MAWNRKSITAHLVDAETGQRLKFQHNPNDIVEEKSTALAAIKIPGLSHPRYQYVAGEPRKISFLLLFFKGAIEESVDWLRSLLYPEHAESRYQSLVKAPSNVDDAPNAVPITPRLNRYRHGRTVMRGSF